jgi:hypothetical protein
MVAMAVTDHYRAALVEALPSCSRSLLAHSTSKLDRALGSTEGAPRSAHGLRTCHPKAAFGRSPSEGHPDAALAAAGLPRQRFHDLRHACATPRLEQGEELAVVSRILGHASITTTANVYGHLTDAMLGRAADRTDVILGRPVASA